MWSYKSLVYVILSLCCTYELLGQNVPSLNWGVSFGGFQSDQAFAIVNDNANNVITAGTVQSTVDFDPGPGVTSLNGGIDIYLSKLNSNGQYLWAKRFSCGASSRPTGLAVDASNNVYLTGYYNGSGDFDPGPGVTNVAAIGSFDFFVSKFNSTGELVWVRNFGSVGYDQANAISVDDFGHVIIAGRFATDSLDFDPGPGEYKLFPGTGGGDIFILSLDTAGNFNWAKSVGGTSINPDIAFGVTTDFSGNVYCTGHFFSTTDFDPGPGTFNLTAVNSDIFILKLDSLGNFKWANRFGSSAASEQGRSIITDAQGNVMLCGEFWSTVDFDPSANVANLVASNGDAFVAKYDSLGNYIWARKFGSTNTDYANSIVIDNLGGVVLTGQYQGTCDFDPGAGVYNLTAVGSADAYILHLTSSGNFQWAGNVGGSNQDVGTGVSVDNSNHIYWTGHFLGTVDTDPSAATNNLTSVGNYDIFVSKFGLYIPLSIEFTSFAGVTCGSNNCLNWQVAASDKLVGFELERGSNTEIFVRIAQIPSKQLTEYSYLDNAPHDGMNYYRLKCFSQDGDYYYSGIVQVKQENDNELRILPTISASGIYNIISESNDLQYYVYDYAGRQIKHETKKLIIDLQDLPQGMYLVRTLKNKVAHTTKILKQ